VFHTYNFGLVFPIFGLGGTPDPSIPSDTTSSAAFIGPPYWIRLFLLASLSQFMYAASVALR
jgi:hypothetical protein